MNVQMNISIVSTDIMAVKLGDQISVPANPVDILATVTREAHDAGLESFVRLIAVDGDGEEHEIVNSKFGTLIKVFKLV
ncbi:hypothetical protein SEA_TIMINATOR_6 [Arthrobacter phage Timinator]|uniref:Uncharacterized protein n=2 Tax=Marthavirus barretlemon TaxID=2560300 RepID=A0A386KQH3_9CAUD|nr:hypothetical protein SEA_TIMINATOR_6 [Arthrobacter phage Timinator]AYD86477.1 hypothetical protein SEA_LEEROYJ_6 [Arthrobacter phage LeeroyJ]